MEAQKEEESGPGTHWVAGGGGGEGWNLSGLEPMP